RSQRPGRAALPYRLQAHPLTSRLRLGGCHGRHARTVIAVLVPGRLVLGEILDRRLTPSARQIAGCGGVLAEQRRQQPEQAPAAFARSRALAVFTVVRRLGRLRRARLPHALHELDAVILENAL